MSKYSALQLTFASYELLVISGLADPFQRRTDR